ncbi:hypothetical protein [Streptomyces sp. NPDC058374]|uniref:hypothetical protein n=1 Tax=Streptomyces sp. NPDC058374 TaxID=3346466 RepID=UPI00364BA4D3
MNGHSQRTHRTHATRAPQEAAITFLTSTPGTVTGITRADEAHAVPGVAQISLPVREGDLIPSLRNSRLGQQGSGLAVAPYGSAAEIAATAESHITITTCDAQIPTDSVEATG